MRLSLSDIEIDKGSCVDPAGRVFHYDGRVFRGISAEYAPVYRRLLQSGFIQDVFSAGLIETWISDIEVEGFDLVVEHKKVPVISLWPEWCSTMIYDATLTICRLNLELCKHGYITKDTQPANIQFIDGKPYWIDLGSIVPLAPDSSFRFENFRCTSLLPLWLLSKGFTNLGKQMYGELGPTGYLKNTSRRRRFRWLPIGYAIITRQARKTNTFAALTRLLAYVEQLSVTPKGTGWVRYAQGGMPPVHQPWEFTKKAKAVSQLLERLTPGTLLDIAGNKGWYAELAASMGHKVISFDIDDASVCSLYEKVKAKGLPILPLVLDFVFPTPAYGIGILRPSAVERLRSDTVLMLALVHHLVFKQKLYFEPITQIVAQYSRKHAIIEFVPRGDRYVDSWYTADYHWYTLENFLRALRCHFPRIEVHASLTAPRKLIMCSK